MAPVHFWGPQSLCIPWLGPGQGSTSLSHCCLSHPSPPFQRESRRLREQDGKMERRKLSVETQGGTKNGWLCFSSVCVFVFVGVCVGTCLVCDIDWSARGGAVSSTSHSIDSDDVVSTRLQVSDRGSGLRARNCELLGITVTPWIDQWQWAKC